MVLQSGFQSNCGVVGSTVISKQALGYYHASVGPEDRNLGWSILMSHMQGRVK